MCCVVGSWSFPWASLSAALWTQSFHRVELRRHKSKVNKLQVPTFQFPHSCLRSSPETPAGIDPVLSDSCQTSCPLIRPTRTRWMFLIWFEWSRRLTENSPLILNYISLSGSQSFNDVSDNIRATVAQEVERVVHYPRVLILQFVSIVTTDRVWMDVIVALFE